MIINSGCANACTGSKGIEDARHTIEIANTLGIKNALVMSTGVIGPFLPMEKIENGLRDAATKVSEGQEG